MKIQLLILGGGAGHEGTAPHSRGRSTGQVMRAQLLILGGGGHEGTAPHSGGRGRS